MRFLQTLCPICATAHAVASALIIILATIKENISFFLLLLIRSLSSKIGSNQFFHIKHYQIFGFNRWLQSIDILSLSVTPLRASIILVSIKRLNPWTFKCTRQCVGWRFCVYAHSSLFCTLSYFLALLCLVLRRSRFLFNSNMCVIYLWKFYFTEQCFHAPLADTL